MQQNPIGGALGLMIENIFLNRFDSANEKWKSKKWSFLSQDLNLSGTSTQCLKESPPQSESYESVGTSPKIGLNDALAVHT